jgi:hypothetical protein
MVWASTKPTYSKTIRTGAPSFCNRMHPALIPYLVSAFYDLTKYAYPENTTAFLKKRS